MTKPRGMMLIHNFRPGPTGGAEIQAERLACSLVSLGHPIRILTNPLAVTGQWHDFGDQVPTAPEEEIFYGLAGETKQETSEDVFTESNGGVVGIIHRPPFSLAYEVHRGVADTFRFLVKNRKAYDILHCHFAYGHAVVSVVAASLLRKRCIIKIACAGEFGEFHNFSKFDGFSSALRVLHQADAMIAVSSEVEQELLGYGFSQEQIVRIPNGVDTDFFHPHGREEKPNKIRFLLVGRRQPQKGVDLLLTAVRDLKIAGLGDKFEVQLCGIDSPGYDYQTMAIKLGVTRLVTFLPFQKDMRPYYQDAHCFLLPSRGEGLSNALLEAMSMGLPVIATRVSGTPEVVANGSDGLLISPNSSDELAEAMKQIIVSAPMRRALGEHARRKVEDGFSLNRVADMYSSLYSRLVHPISGRQRP